MKAKFIAECVGTFFLCAVVGMAVLPPGAADWAALAIGLTLAIMVYSTGHISGGHLNPAVTMGVFIQGSCPRREVLPYFGAQLLGGIIAFALVLWIKPDPTEWLAAQAPMELGKALGVEFLFTFGLVWVVLNVAVARANAGNSYFGLAIGGWVAAGILAVGGISGGVFNPAVGLTAALLGFLGWGNLAAYVVVQLLGGIAAGLVFKATVSAQAS